MKILKVERIPEQHNFNVHFDVFHSRIEGWKEFLENSQNDNSKKETDQTRSVVTKNFEKH